MKYLLSLLFFLLALIFPSGSYAQTDGQPGYYTIPQPENITDFTQEVTVTFYPEESPFISSFIADNYFICMEQDLCIDDKGIREGIFNSVPEDVASATSIGLTEDEIDEKTVERYRLTEPTVKSTPENGLPELYPGVGQITVCGDGPSKLKPADQENYDGYENDDNWWDGFGDRRGCEPGRDYFHAGSIYMMAVYEKATSASSDGDDVYILRAINGFYINHGLPEVIISVDGRAPYNLKPGEQFSVEIRQPVGVPLRGHGKTDVTSSEAREVEEKRNNYHISIQGPGISPDKTIQDGGEKKFIAGNGNACASLSAANTSTDGSVYEGVTLPTDTGIAHGTYTIEVREQVNEIGEDKENRHDNCRGGFVYYRIVCHVLANSDPSLSQCDQGTYDPDKIDFNSSLASLSRLGIANNGVPLPCRIDGSSGEGGCAEVNTAVGSIPTDPLQFITRVFEIVLSIAGIAAIFILVFWGYRIMTSRGDAEALKTAREHITSAIIGLIFIVLSFVVIQVIGADILRVPGFNEDDEFTPIGEQRRSTSDDPIDYNQLPWFQ